MKAPKFVPFFEAKHILMYGGGIRKWVDTPQGWLRRIFGYSAQYKEAHSHWDRTRKSCLGYCYFALSQETSEEAQAAADVLNEILEEMGYTEDVPGKWTKCG